MLAPQRRAQRELAKVDLLLVPTALHHYTVEEIQEEEVRGDKVRHFTTTSDITIAQRNGWVGAVNQQLSNQHAPWSIPLGIAKLGRHCNAASLPAGLLTAWLHVLCNPDFRHNVGLDAPHHRKTLCQEWCCTRR